LVEPSTRTACFCQTGKSSGVITGIGPSGETTCAQIDDENKENEMKANSIITTNIYGDNVPVNIATGNNVTQKNELKVENIDFEKLKILSVETEHLQELKEIVENSNGDKKTFASKAIGWLGKVTASLAAKKIYDSIPLVTEYIQTLC
jgi:hypothetical protein